MTPISATPSLPLVLPQTEAAPAAGSEVAGEGAEIFSEMLSSAAVLANQRIHQGQAAGAAFAAGQSDDIHGTMLALTEADIQLKLVGSVRNKVIDAFYELWRMQI